MSGKRQKSGDKNVQLIVPPSNITLGPAVAPHDPFMIRLPEVSELLYEEVYLFTACRSVRRRAFDEIACELL